MKHIYKVIILLAAFTIGCSDDFLDTKDPNRLSLSQWYKTEKDAFNALTSCYSPIKHGGMFGNSFEVIFYSADDRALFETNYWELFLYDSNEGRVKTMWDDLYRGLFRVNSLLENVGENIPMDEALRNRYRAEATFLRGVYHFYLVSLFNRPILLTFSPKTYDEAIQGNSTPEAVWAQVEADFSAAADVLPLSYGSSDLGRATKGAAMAFLAKAYLYQEKWAEARDMFKAVMDLGVYSLSMPKAPFDSADYVNAYLANFSPITLVAGSNTYPAENNAESVFEIQYGNDPSDWNYYLPGWGMAGSLNSAYFSPLGWRNVAPTKKFVDQFESGGPAGLPYDPRRYATVFTPGEIIETREGKTAYGVAFDPNVHSNPAIQQGFGLKKYYFPMHNDVPAPYDDPNNWRVIRYADVLLMYAEACYHTGNLTEGLDALNQVRARAGMPDITDLTPEAIMHERDVEFGLECIRFKDLVRWSLLKDGPWVEKVSDYCPNFTKGKNEYLPIPLQEINKMKGKLTQNPGW